MVRGFRIHYSVKLSSIDLFRSCNASMSIWSNIHARPTLTTTKHTYTYQTDGEPPLGAYQIKRLKTISYIMETLSSFGWVSAPWISWVGIGCGSQVGCSESMKASEINTKVIFDGNEEGVVWRRTDEFSEHMISSVWVRRNSQNTKDLQNSPNNEYRCDAMLRIEEYPLLLNNIWFTRFLRERFFQKTNNTV